MITIWLIQFEFMMIQIRQTDDYLFILTEKNFLATLTLSNIDNAAQCDKATATVNPSTSASLLSAFRRKKKKVPTTKRRRRLLGVSHFHLLLRDSSGHSSEPEESWRKERGWPPPPSHPSLPAFTASTSFFSAATQAGGHSLFNMTDSPMQRNDTHTRTIHSFFLSTDGSLQLVAFFHLFCWSRPSFYRLWCYFINCLSGFMAS